METCSVVCRGLMWRLRYTGVDITAITHANARCYVWLYYYWLFMFDCICAVLRGSLLYISCGLSAVKINEQLL